MPFAVFCPPLIPMLRPIATAFPDKNMRQVRADLSLWALTGLHCMQQ